MTLLLAVEWPVAPVVTQVESVPPSGAPVKPPHRTVVNRFMQEQMSKCMVNYTS